MTRRLLIAAALATAGLGIAGPSASATTDLRTDNPKYACLWFGTEGLCISNPGLPSVRLP